jgi:GNAT superfamily N-acetyltransferase
MAPRQTVEVRSAVRADLPKVLWFLRRKAAFDGDTLRATPEGLTRALFGSRPRCGVLLAEHDGSAAGFAFYFETFSSFQGGPCLWLDDLFVLPSSRGAGVGKALLAELARVAVRRGCARIDWTVEMSNTRAIRFYRARGARVKAGTRLCRLGQADLRALAAAGP